MADAQGRMWECLNYAADGLAVRRELTVRAAQGNVTDVFVYREDGSLEERWAFEYEFDAKGNWIKKLKSRWVNKEVRLSRWR